MLLTIRCAGLSGASSRYTPRKCVSKKNHHPNLHRPCAFAHLTCMTEAPAIDRRPIPEAALNQLFHEAHTTSEWLAQPVPERLLREIYNLTRLGPTSANTQPARFVFVITEEAKARLLPAMSAGNQDKTRTAPVTVLIAWDAEFYEHLPRTFPQANFRPLFAANKALAEETAFRNSSIEGGYFILAARALGLDCGPMSGW